MVPKIHASGGSFRGVMAYCLGDKRIEKPEADDDPTRDPAERERLQREWEQWERQQAERPRYWAGEVSKRVGWTETLNLDTDKPRQAARRMAATASYSQELKRQAGIPAGGRRLEKPVCHYTLAWKEGETPGRREMVKAVKESLAVLGMADRQAVVVSHKDGKCAHAHVVVNRVSWQDGRAAKLSKSRLELSKWAESWEKERGEVQCKRRVEHNRIRSTGKAVYDRESRIRDQAHHRSPKKVFLNRFEMRDGKDALQARHVARFRVVERDMAQGAIRLHQNVKAALLTRHRQEWSQLYARQRDERSGTSGLAKQAVRAVLSQIPASREEQAIGRAVGRALSKQLSKISSERSGAWRLEARHKQERRELGERQLGERDALLKRTQVDYYDKPMAKAHQQGYEFDRNDERTSRDYQREMQRQGFGEQEGSQKADRARAPLGGGERLVPESEEERAEGPAGGEAGDKLRAQAKRSSGEEQEQKPLEQAAPPKRRWGRRRKKTRQEAAGDKAGKSSRSSSQAYTKEVATRVAKQVEEGKAPWQKGYDKASDADLQPFNPTTGKRFKGLNAIQLKSVAQEKGYHDPRWMSLQAANRVGTKVRKGERGTRVEYLRFPPKSQASPGKGSPEAAAGDKQQEQPRISHHTYVVFNAEQIERMPALEQQLPKEPQQHEICERAERMIQDSGVKIENPPEGHHYVKYDRSTDAVVIPGIEKFKSPEDYYGQAVKQMAGRAAGEQHKDRPEPQSEAQQHDATARQDMRREMATDTICSKLHLPKQPTGERHKAQWAENIRNSPNELRYAARDADRMADQVLAHDRPQQRSQAEPSRESSIAQVTPERVQQTQRALERQQQQPERETGYGR